MDLPLQGLREQPADQWAVIWHQDLVPSTSCFRLLVTVNLRDFLARTEAPASFGNFVHRLMPAVRLRAYDRSDMLGPARKHDSLKVKAESFVVRGGKKERRKQCSKKVYPAFLVIVSIIIYYASSLKLRLWIQSSLLDCQMISAQRAFSSSSASCEWDPQALTARSPQCPTRRDVLGAERRAAVQVLLSVSWAVHWRGWTPLLWVSWCLRTHW